MGWESCGNISGSLHSPCGRWELLRKMMHLHVHLSTLRLCLGHAEALLFMSLLILIETRNLTSLEVVIRSRHAFNNVPTTQRESPSSLLAKLARPHMMWRTRPHLMWSTWPDMIVHAARTCPRIRKLHLIGCPLPVEAVTLLPHLREAVLQNTRLKVVEALAAATSISKLELRSLPYGSMRAAVSLHGNIKSSTLECLVLNGKFHDGALQLSCPKLGAIQLEGWVCAGMQRTGPSETLLRSALRKQGFKSSNETFEEFRDRAIPPIIAEGGSLEYVRKLSEMP